MLQQPVSGMEEALFQYSSHRLNAGRSSSEFYNLLLAV